MQKPNNRSSRSKIGKGKLSDLDLGPAWLPLHDAWRQLIAQYTLEVGASFLTDALTSGRITIFTDSLYLTEPRSGGWGGEYVSRIEAKRRELILDDLAGPTASSLALDSSFWARFPLLPEHLLDWQDQNLNLSEPVKRGQNAWELRRPIISSFQLNLVKQQIDNRSYVPPAPKRKGGRPRESRWHAWTAHLVEYVLNKPLPKPDSVELADESKLREFIEATALDIARTIEAELSFEDGGMLERRETVPTITSVLRHHLNRNVIGPG